MPTCSLPCRQKSRAAVYAAQRSVPSTGLPLGKPSISNDLLCRFFFYSAKDNNNNAHPEAVAVHCRWRDGGTSTQDIYDARSIKRRVRVTAAMLA